MLRQPEINESMTGLGPLGKDIVWKAMRRAGTLSRVATQVIETGAVLMGEPQPDKDTFVQKMREFKTALDGLMAEIDMV
jgi:hypothetical protein